MKVINSLIVILSLFLIGFFIYHNYDRIKTYIDSKIPEEKNIIIENENTYTRNYKYLYFNEENNYIPKNTSDIENIYFNILNNGWEHFTFYCPEEYVRCIDDVRKIANDKIHLSKINNYINPFNSFNQIKTEIRNNEEIYVNITKTYNEKEIKELNQRIDEIIEELNLGGENIYNQVKKIHDYIIDNTTYDDNFKENKDYSLPSNKASGPLIKGIAICSGYADAFALFMDRMNIPNLKVSSEEHVWNLIYYNSRWLHIDLTWDDDEKIKNNRSNYFLIDTYDLKSKNDDSHAFDENFFIETKNITFDE